MRSLPSILFITAVACAATLSSCDKTETQQDTSTIEFKTFTGHSVYRLEGSAEEFMQDSDVCYIDSANLLMPVKLYGHDISALRDSILFTAFDTVAADPALARDAYFLNSVSDLGYNAVPVARVDTTEVFANGFNSVTGEILNLSQELLTYRVSRDIYYPGAAHGMTTKYYLTYYIPEARIMRLHDIFTPEGLEKLPALISARARQLAPAIGPTSIDGLPSMGNFYITLDYAIVFVYQPYEVASYAQGAIAVSFYPYQLTDLLTPAGQKLLKLN